MVLSGVSLLVEDQEAAKRFFLDQLGFFLKEDVTDSDTGHRWLVVSADIKDNVGIILSLASEQQKSLIGKQAGEGVFLILQTPDFDTKYQQMVVHGIEFCEAPRTEPYGKVVVFKDLCGNQWDLIERY